MSNPQQPELRRSGYTPAAQDSAKLRAGDDGDSDGRVGQVPADNQPGHHPEQEQDKPAAPPNRAAAADGEDGS